MFIVVIGIDWLKGNQEKILCGNRIVSINALNGSKFMASSEEICMI